MLHVTTQVYHSMGNYKQALQRYLNDSGHPETAFRCSTSHILIEAMPVSVLLPQHVIHHVPGSAFTLPVSL